MISEQYRNDCIVEASFYKYDVFTFSRGYENYYFYDELDLADPVRTNLRYGNDNENTVMGAFGSMTSEKINFRIIDCTSKSIDSKEVCESDSITHSVCEWRENVSLYDCTGEEEDREPRDRCMPINFSTEDCE